MEVEERNVEVVVKQKEEEIERKAMESASFNPAMLARFKTGRYKIEKAMYRGAYVASIPFSAKELSVEEVHFGVDGVMSVWLNTPEEKLKVEINVKPAIGEFQNKDFETVYNEYYRVWAQRRISKLNSELTDAKIVLRVILEEVRRKEPELFEELLIERATENASIEQLLEELGVEIEDC